MDHTITIKPHYHFVTKMLVELFNEKSLPNVAEISIEPIYGYVGRMKYKDGHVHIFRGTNLGVNSVGAAEISKDKGYTKFFLQEIGIKTPEGSAFLTQSYLEKIKRKQERNKFSGIQRVSFDAIKYVSEFLGYPCYAKPNFGSQGRGIVRCYDAKDLESAITDFEKEEKIFIVEKAINMPDYRIVTFDNEVISCYKRIPLQILGDGKSSIKELLDMKQEDYFRSGREEIINLNDMRMLAKLKRNGLSLESILPQKEVFQLLDVSNLSMGGESEEFSDAVHQKWKDLALLITQEMGLRLCGVDIACNNLISPDSDYSILEINAAPGLDNYASSGAEQFQRVKNLYKKIFNEA